MLSTDSVSRTTVQTRGRVSHYGGVMRIEIKNLQKPIVQTQETIEEMKRITDGIKNDDESITYKDIKRLARLKKLGKDGYPRSMVIHPPKEEPADVPTIDNPDGIPETSIPEDDEIEEATQKTIKMVSDVNASGKERQYDEDGDPLPFSAQELTEKSFRRIIKEIKTGVSPYQACINKRVLPHQFFDACKQNKDWEIALADAREVYCESQVARLEKLAQQVQRGTIDVAIYASICGNIKWLIERLFPRVYGSKATVEQTVTHQISVDQKKLKELNDMLRGKERKPKAITVDYQEIK